jgi:hypothetical protein
MNIQFKSFKKYRLRDECNTSAILLHLNGSKIKKIIQYIQ